jgi:hypothetical protein
MQSEAIGELAAALAKAQKAIKAPKKGRTATVPTKAGGQYKYTYADLADVIDCYRDELSDNGLAVTQTMRVQDGHMVLITSLLHATGQWIASEYPLQNYDRPQEQGSAITYARRYSVTSLLGIAAEDDDDGQAAQQAEPVKREERALRPPAPPPPAPGPVSDDAAAILTLAAEISDMVKIPAETIIKDASSFVDTKTGKTVPGFSDPRTKEGNPKWLKGTKAKLEKQLLEERMKAEVTEEVPF